MVELNNSASRPVKVLGPYSYSIEDTTGYGNHIRGGYSFQVRRPRECTSSCIFYCALYIVLCVD